MENTEERQKIIQAAVDAAIMILIGRNFWSLVFIAGFFALANFVHADPYVFWVNNNYDRTNYNADDNAIDADGLDSLQVLKLPSYQQVPDCNFVDASGQRVIPCTRDLQDFARLWIAGVTSNLVAALPANSTLTLS